MSAREAQAVVETARASARNGCNCAACLELRGTLAELETALTAHRESEARRLASRADALRAGFA